MKGNEDKFLDSDTNEVILDPEKYFLKMDTNLDVIDDFLDDVQYLDEKYASRILLFNI